MDWLDIFGTFRAPDFFQVAAAKDFSEMVPHNTQSFLMLGVAVERYILVCHAAVARQYYKGKVRFGFYFLITLLIVLTSVLPLGEVIYYIVHYDSVRGEVNSRNPSPLEYFSNFSAKISF